MLPSPARNRQPLRLHSLSLRGADNPLPGISLSTFASRHVAEWFHIRTNWLQVLDTAERTQIYQRVRHQFHTVVSLLDAFKAEQQPFEFVLPGKRPLDPQA